MTLRRTPTLLLAGALALGLAACDAGGGEPTTKPTTSATTTSVPAETSSAPSEEPSTPAVAAPNPADYPGMDQQTEEGAKQTFRYFWATLIYGYQTGDSEPFDAVSDPGCEYCADAKADIEQIRQSREYWSKADATFTDHSTNQVDANTFDVGLGFTVPGHSEFDQESNVRLDVAEKKYGAAGRLAWSQDRWVVSVVDLAE